MDQNEQSKQLRQMRIDAFGSDTPPDGYRFVNPEDIMGDPISLVDMIGMLSTEQQAAHEAKRCLCCGGIAKDVHHDG